MSKPFTPEPNHLSAAVSYGRAARARRYAIMFPHCAERENASAKFWKESGDHHRRMAELAKPARTWIDTSGDDLFAIHNTGRLLPSKPLAFGPPRFLYLHEGNVLEVTPTVHAETGLSAWKITIRQEALNV